jgi:hypothetical protein
VLTVLRQRPAEHVVEAAEAPHPRRLLLHVRPHGLGVAGAPERRFAGEALVEHAAERVHVGPRVHVVAPDLLGGEVVERADDTARVGRGPAELLRDAEVGEVRVIVPVQEDVRGLHVAVHERPAVRGVERAGHLGEDRQGACRAELPLVGQEGAQVPPLHEAHREVEVAVVLPRLVYRDDVRVVE